ncbi:DMT family transporter [Leptolyngbya sp. AN02str]|uniref:DMT family transporter n=1 Tax=Leptolyngbya sp. AN02str TaxID=3423363 RepID=UPI003D313DD3
MNSPAKPSTSRIVIILTIGILSVSTSAIFIRLAFQSANTNSIGFSLVLAAARLTLASVALIPVWRTLGDRPFQPRALYYSAGAGLFLAIHFAAWISSLSYTSIAASTSLVTTNPIWVALLSWLWYRDVPSRLTVIGMSLALAGSVLISMGDGTSNIGTNPMLGNGLALLGSWAVSLYFLFGREAQQRGLAIRHHAAVTYSVGALLLLPLPLLLGTGYGNYPSSVYLYISFIALFPQLIGHTSLNWAVRWVSPTLVTLTILAEPIGSSLLGYVVFRENPGPLVGLGALTILLGVAIATLGAKRDVASPSSS